MILFRKVCLFPRKSTHHTTGGDANEGTVSIRDMVQVDTSFTTNRKDDNYHKLFGNH